MIYLEFDSKFKYLNMSVLNLSFTYISIIDLRIAIALFQNFSKTYIVS